MKKIFILFIVLSLGVGIVNAQDRTITGVVKDSKGHGLAGATIQAKGTSVGTFAKAGGNFKITIPSTVKALIFKYVGMKYTEVALGEKDELDVVMQEDALKSDEVVVTAIGIERSKKSLGYTTQEVSGSELVGARETNIVNAISSKVAGVQVTSATGSPGGASFIRSRGSSSIEGSNQPLFIIDGIPIDNSQSYSGNPDDGRNNLLSSVNNSNRAIDIDPSTIDNINVLKGPAATALYGIRASGGAVIITTKKGKPTYGDKVNIQLNSSWSFDNVNMLPEIQSKYSQGGGGRYSAPSPGASRSWGALNDTLYWDGNASYKWDKNGAIVGKSDPTAKTKITPYDNMDTYFKTGLTASNGINMFGGDENATYYFSFNNLTSNGVVPNSTWTRNNFKVSGSAAIAKSFKASANLNYVNSGGTRIQQGSNTSGVMLGLTRTPNTFDNSNGFSDAADQVSSYQFADGSQRNYRAGTGYDNPFWASNNSPMTDDVNRMFGNVQLDWNIADGIDVMYRLGADFYTDRRKQIFALGSRTAPAGRVFEDQHFNRDITGDLILTLNTNFNDDWSGQLLLGNNMFSTESQQLFVQGDGLGAPDFFNLSNAQGQISREILGRKRTAAFYADGRLSYKNALFFNITGRNEWSTSLPEANNTFFYPSASVAAVFTELFPEMKSDLLSFLKLRVNVASVGKDAPIYGTVTTFSQGFYQDGWTNGVSFPFGGTIGYQKSDVLGNPDLKPESTTSWEIGADIRLWENRLAFDLTYYNQTSKDQIFQVPIAATSGYLAQLKNAGSIENKGIEAVITGSPIVNEDLRWDITVNFTKNNITVLSLAEGVDNIFLGGFEGSSVRAVAGQPYGSIFGFGWLRNANGDIVIDDDPTSDNYGYPILDPNEKSFGSANPDWMMGIRNTLSWNGFNFSFLFDIRQGGVVWNGTKSALYFFGTAKETEDRGTTKVFTGAKQSDGSKNDIAAPWDENWLAFGNGNGFIGSNTEDFIEDGSWVRLREVNLSYTFPSDFLKGSPFSGLVVNVTARNLWLSTKYTGVDPETNLMGAHNAQGLDYFNMPNTRSFVFSASLNF